jgi:cobalt-zinc-cadmium efflux system membrane fusion protein
MVISKPCELRDDVATAGDDSQTDATRRSRAGIAGRLVVYWALGFAVLIGTGLTWFELRARRIAAADAEPADEAPNDGAPLASEVRLSRAELGQAAGIEVAPVESRAVENKLACNGNAQFNLNKYVKVPPKADGILGKINVDVGSSVRAGDVLAVINSQAFGDLKASLLNAMVHEEHLRWQVDRYAQAVEGIAAKSLFEARHFLEEQLTDTARIRERLREHGLDAAQIEKVVKDKDIRIQLPMLAPRDGVIVERQAVEGEVAHTQEPLFAIADLSTMWVQLYVYENDLSKVRLGQRVTFVPDGLGGEGFEGAITWISPEVDSQTRAISLRAEVVNRGGALRANMFGKGQLLEDHAEPRVVVPQAAVQSLGGNPIVFVEKPDNLFEVRKIVVGLKTERFWEVTSGLKPGERVATTGSFLLKSNLENPDFGKVE